MVQAAEHRFHRGLRHLARCFGDAMGYPSPGSHDKAPGWLSHSRIRHHRARGIRAAAKGDRPRDHPAGAEISRTTQRSSAGQRCLPGQDFSGRAAKNLSRACLSRFSTLHSGSPRHARSSSSWPSSRETAASSRCGGTCSPASSMRSESAIKPQRSQREGTRSGSADAYSAGRMKRYASCGPPFPS